MQVFYRKTAECQVVAQEQEAYLNHGKTLALKIRIRNPEEEKKKNPERLWIV